MNIRTKDKEIEKHRIKCEEDLEWQETVEDCGILTDWHCPRCGCSLIIVEKITDENGQRIARLLCMGGEAKYTLSGNDEREYNGCCR